jgi:glucokinase
MLISSSSARAAPIDPRLDTFLVGDVGGTNCRLSLAQADEDGMSLHQPKAYKCAAFADAQAAIGHYLQSVGWTDPVAAAVIAVAGPITEGVVQSTNMRWRMSEAELRTQATGKVKLINDYTAFALAIDHLGDDDVVHLGPPGSGPGKDTVAVIGAGTGFGIGAVTRGIGGPTVIATEGGHISFAPVDRVEMDILRILTRRFGRVSIERLLSGPGLVNIRTALAEIGGVHVSQMTSEDIVRTAGEGDALSERTLERFCAIYGSVAGDVALMFGARGGVFLGGGIAPAIARHLQSGEFRSRFEAKGRFRNYASGIPTSIIINTYAPLLGAAFLAKAS